MKHVILFSGHMVDDNDRAEPRFPASKVEGVKKEIVDRLTSLKIKKGDSLLGIAGCAAGSDILFHEACEAADIPSEIFLAFPFEQYKKRSVAFAGGRWIKTFDRLVEKLPTHVLSVKDVDGDNIWERANEWMLDVAKKINDGGITALVVWDEKRGDGEGGTSHVVTIAEQNRIPVDKIKL